MFIAVVFEDLADTVTSLEQFSKEELSILLYIWSLHFQNKDNCWVSDIVSALKIEESDAHKTLTSLILKGVNLRIKVIKI